MNLLTIFCNSADIFDKSLAACLVLDAPSAVFLETMETESMFLAISVLPEAASATVLPISLAVAACSSTALAMIPEISLILLMIPEIDAMAQQQ